MAIVIVGSARWLRGDEALIPPRPAHCAVMASVRSNDRKVCFTAGRRTSGGLAKANLSASMPFSAAMPLRQFSRPRRHAAGHAEQQAATCVRGVAGGGWQARTGSKDGPGRLPYEQEMWARSHSPRGVHQGALSWL
jgi:hypothetical protein